MSVSVILRTRRSPVLVSALSALALALTTGAMQATAAAQSAATQDPLTQGAAAQAASAHPGGLVLFVSPNGDDANPGTNPLRPLRTLEHTRDVVRTLGQNMTSNITVELLSGTYRLAQPLALDAEDSGTNGYQVVWTAAPGARPVISGGERITGWHLSDPAK